MEPGLNMGTWIIWHKRLVSHRNFCVIINVWWKRILRFNLFIKEGTQNSDLSCTLTKFHVKNGRSKYTNAGILYAYVINTALWNIKDFIREQLLDVGMTFCWVIKLKSQAGQKDQPHIWQCLSRAHVEWKGDWYEPTVLLKSCSTKITDGYLISFFKRSFWEGKPYCKNGASIFKSQYV